MWPSAYVGSGLELRVCSEVLDDIASFISVDIRCAYGAVVGSENLNCLRTDAKGKFKGADSKAKAVVGAEGVVE